MRLIEPKKHVYTEGVFFSQKTYRHPLGKWLNSSVYHNLHHEKFQGNYGLYFTIWDRLCGTLRTDSAEKIAEVHQRIAEKAREDAPMTKALLRNSQASQ